MWVIYVCMIVLLPPTMSRHVRGPRNTTGTYQITEKIDDIPDHRTLAPIDPTFGIQVPLNFGNNTLNNNNVDKTTEHIPIINPYEVPDSPGSENKPNPGTYEVTEIKPDAKPDQSKNPMNKTDKLNVKKNSFSILHIKGEFDNNEKLSTNNKVPNNNAGFKGFLDGLRSYLYSMKRGLVDGLYNWYHKDEAQKEIDKFYRSFNKDTDDDTSSEDDVRNWIHRNEVQKEIDDFYKHFNDDSDEENEPEGPKGDAGKAGGPKYDETEPVHPGGNEHEPSGPDYGENGPDDGETNDDDVDVRFGEQHGQDYNNYDDYHYHGRHKKFGDCK